MLQKCYFSPSHRLVICYKKITMQIAQKARKDYDVNSQKIVEKAYKIYVLSNYLAYIL